MLYLLCQFLYVCIVRIHIMVYIVVRIVRSHYCERALQHQNEHKNGTHGIPRGTSTKSQSSSNALHLKEFLYCSVVKFCLSAILLMPPSRTSLGGIRLRGGSFEVFLTWWLLRSVDSQEAVSYASNTTMKWPKRNDLGHCLWLSSDLLAFTDIPLDPASCAGWPLYRKRCRPVFKQIFFSWLPWHCKTSSFFKRSQPLGISTLTRHSAHRSSTCCSCRSYKKLPPILLSDCRAKKNKHPLVRKSEEV